MIRVQRSLWPSIDSLVLAALIALFVVYPLVRLFAGVFESSDTGQATAVQVALRDPILGRAIQGTITLTLLTMIVATPLGILLAWITATTDAPLRRQLSNLPTIALTISPLVASLGWLVLLSPRVGLINQLVRAIVRSNAPSGPFDAYSVPVIVMVMAIYAIPYVFGPTFAAFNNFDATLEEAARVAGVPRLVVFATITLPALRPAILAGVLVGAMITASTFSVPLILSSGTGLTVIPTLIYQDIAQMGNYGAGLTLASMLSIFTLLGMVLYLRALGTARYTLVSGKGGRYKRTRLGGWRWVATGGMLVFGLIGLGLPVLALLYISLVGFWGPNVFAEPFTLAQYQQVAAFPFALTALKNSLWLAGLAAIVAVTLGFLTSYRSVRSSNWINTIVQTGAGLPLGLPAIVVGLAVLFAFTGKPLPLYGTAAILIVGYTVHMLPIAIRSSDAAIRQIGPELEEASRTCGDSYAGALLRVIVPVLRQPLIGTAAICFVILFQDLPISIMLYTPATIPSAVSLFQIFDQGQFGVAAAYSILISAICGLMVITTNRLGLGVEEVAGS